MRSLATSEGWARHLVSHGSLFAYSLPSRVALHRRRLDLRRTIAALPVAPMETRRISVVIPAGADIDLSCGANVERVTTVGSASGSLVCFLAATSEPLEDQWLVRLAHEVRDDIVAATPLLVRGQHLLSGTPADLRVEALGYDVLPGRDGAARLNARRAGTPPDGRAPVEDVASASSACFLVARHALEAIGGLDSDLDGDAAIADLCVRLRSNGGRIVAVPSAVVADHRRVDAIAQLRDPFALRNTEWSSVIDRHGPVLLHSARPSAAQRIAITTAAPSLKVAPRWGDWHFGDALARALRRSGLDVVLQTARRERVRRRPIMRRTRRAARPRVRSAYARPEPRVVGHQPSRVARNRGRRGGRSRARRVRPLRVGTARTDIDAGRDISASDGSTPLPASGIGSRHAHGLVVVAKTRGVMRASVADAIAAGLQPAIYGSGWRGLVDPKLIIADHIDNEELPRGVRVGRGRAERPLGRACARTDSSRIGSSTCSPAVRPSSPTSFPKIAESVRRHGPDVSRGRRASGPRRGHAR